MVGGESAQCGPDNNGTQETKCSHARSALQGTRNGGTMTSMYNKGREFLLTY